MSSSGSSGTNQKDNSSSNPPSSDRKQASTSAQGAQDNKQQPKNHEYSDSPVLLFKAPKESLHSLPEPSLPPDLPLTDSPIQQQPGPGANINFPSVLHVGRHVDGDTDEINVIVCTQRSRRRYAGELPRCYTLGWRHINNFEVPPLGKASVMPPKLGQQREVPGYWKERVIGSRDVPTWEGDQDDDAELTERPINVVDKPDIWTEGNYLSVGTGSSSAHERILAMNVPLQAYDVHRKFREELWTAERVAENMAKHHAQLHKQRLKAEEQKKQTEKVQTAAFSAAAAVASKTTSEKPQHAVNAESSAKEQPSTSNSSTTFSTSTVKGPSEVKTKGFTSEEKDSSQATPSQQPSPPPPPPPVDRRFAPEKVARAPWYRRLYNYTPPPTGWTSDETYGHRTYIIPHPIHAAKENLMRSWAVVLTPTWKVTKALVTSFTSGTQRRFWGEMWNFSREGGHAGLVVQIRTGWQKKVLEERERIDKEKKERGESSPPSSSGANGGSSTSPS